MSTTPHQSTGAGDPHGGGDETNGKLTEDQIRNFVDNVETLNVVVERPVAGWKPSHPIAEDSSMLPSDGTKGLALIINIVDFKDDITNASRRYGSEHDAEYLTDLLIQLDYNVYPTAKNIRNGKKSKSVIESQIQSFKTLCMEQSPKSIIVFIGSHGKHPNKIVTWDRKWMNIYEDIIYKFTLDKNFTVLDKKPKIFLVQACQSYYLNGESMMPRATIHQIPPTKIKDVYICTSTTPGKSSKRDVYKGSWFPYCFTYMMMKHALEMKSLQQIMKLVKNMMLQIENYQEFKQVPSITSGSIDTDLYFVKSDYNWSGVRNYDPSWLVGASELCIISTIDKQITCEKVIEYSTTRKYSFLLHEWKDFQEFLSSDRGRLKEEVVDVVMNVTLEDLELCFRELERQHVVFITDVDQQSILELDLAKYNVDVKLDQMPFEHLSTSFIKKIKERMDAKYGISLNNNDLKGELLIDIISGREMFQDEIKSRLLPYYVDRMLLTRNIISTKIFSESYSADIFLIQAINLGQGDLGSLLGKFGENMTGASQDNLVDVHPNISIMKLDNDSHFETICEKTHKSVHMLNYEDRVFRWIQSKGNIGAVQKHVAEEQEEQMEEHFCSMISTDSCAPVCISDSPGMGKTTLLVQIGKRLRRMFHYKTVLFVELSMFTQRVKNIDVTLNSQSIVRALQDITCRTTLGRLILESKLLGKISNGVQIELMLDGFDELNRQDSADAHYILQTIRAKLPSVRMWVTSRPQKLKELEDTLGGLGYNIKAFQKSDQINFLTRFWSRHKHIKLNDQRLEDFASHCLDSLKNKMNSSEKDIAGIPLQCLLIGEVYEKQAHSHARKNATAPLPARFDVSSITTLYQEVIKNKLEIYRSKFGSQRSPDDSGGIICVIKNWVLSLGGVLLGMNELPPVRQTLSDEKLMSIHAQMGLAIIFKDLFDKLSCSFTTSELEEVLNLGVWEFSGTVVPTVPTAAIKGTLAASSLPRVIHRTFAEYFAALFIRDKLVSGSGLERIVAEFFMETVLQRKMNKDNVPEFTYPVVIYFLNSLLAPHPKLPEISIIPNNYLADVINERVNNRKEDMGQIAYACAYADCGNILNFLNDIGVFQSQAMNIFNKEFMSFAIMHSGVEVIRFGFLHFEEHYKNEFDSDNYKCELLRLAVDRGKYAPVDFLLNVKRFRKVVEDLNLHDGAKTLLHHCLAGTRKNVDVEICERLEILRMLDGINNQLKEQINEKQETPLLVESAHVLLHIELICRGANVKAQRKNGNTILQSTLYYSNEDYNKVVDQIKQTGMLGELVHMKDNDGEPPLYTEMSSFELMPETLEMFSDAGADFNFINKYGTSVLKRAIRFGRNVTTLQKLIELGADANYRGEDGNTLLHEAVDNGKDYAAGLKFLVDDHGLNVNATNKAGETPLDIVLMNRTYNFEVGLAVFELGGINNNVEDSLCQRTTRDILESRGRRRRVASREGREDSLSDDDFWARTTFDKNREMKPFYVDILLLYIYLFGPEIVDSRNREMTSPSPHPLNYANMIALLFRKGASDRSYMAMERLNEILRSTIGRTNPPIWDPETITKFHAGELI